MLELIICWGEVKMYHNFYAILFPLLPWMTGGAVTSEVTLAEEGSFYSCSLGEVF